MKKPDIVLIEADNTFEAICKDFPMQLDWREMKGVLKAAFKYQAATYYLQGFIDGTTEQITKNQKEEKDAIIPSTQSPA